MPIRVDLLVALSGMPMSNSGNATPHPNPPRADLRGVLTKHDIESSNLIVEGAAECFQPASYDLRLGDEFVKPGDLDGDTGKPIVRKSSALASLEIKPFSSVIVSSFEKLDLPANVIGKFDLRIRHAISGLMVQMGTQIEPRYKGRVFALIHNITDRPINLRYKETRIFTVEFHYTNGDAPPPTKDKNGKTLSEYLDGHALSSTFDSLISKGEREFGRLQKKVRDTSNTRVAFIALIFTVAFSSLVPIVVTRSLDNATGDQKSVETLAKSAEKTAEDAKRDAFALEDQLRSLRKEFDASERERQQLLMQINEIRTELNRKAGDVDGKNPSPQN